MATAAKTCMQPDIEELLRLLVTGVDARQDENVGVVVLATETGQVFGADHGGANARKPVGGDGHADAALADQHSAVKVPREQLARNNERVLRVIHRVGRVRAEIRERISVLRQPVLQRRLDLDAAVIARQRNA